MGLVGKLNHASLRVHIHKKAFFYYYELMQGLREAKSAVFDIVEKEPSFLLKKGCSYERLGKKRMMIYEQEDYSRKEIAESVNALRKIS